MYVQVNCHKKDCDYYTDTFCIELDGSIVIVDSNIAAVTRDVKPDIENITELNIRQLEIKNDYIVEKCPNGHKNRFNVKDIESNKTC